MPTPPAISSDPQARQEQEAFARQVLQAEADAVARVAIGPSFHQAVDLILAATAEDRHGSVVVSGLGKSGLIGAKLSATFASTGTPSHFIHPTEAMHGDLGRVRKNDLVLVLSFGGNTDEVVNLVTILRQDKVPVIAIVGKENSDLARLATATLSIGDVAEACPLNLAPTASTTAMLALGDALALCVMRRRNFAPEDFYKNHPAGSLGKQLTPVVQAMRFRSDQNLPLIQSAATIEEAFSNAESHSPGGRRAGAILIVDAAGCLAGIFTDGDLRRVLLKQGSKAWREPIGQFMTRNPRRLNHEALVRDAVQMVREFRIDEIPIVDAAGRPLGLIDVQDLVALKVIEG